MKNTLRIHLLASVFMVAAYSCVSAQTVLVQIAAHVVDAFSTLPGRRRRLSLHLPTDLPPGRYVA